MNYLDIMKEAWRVTWRFKTLWILGLFAGTVGGSWGTSSYRADSSQVSQWSSPSSAWAQVTNFVHDWAPALIAGAVALVLIGALWLILSLAAQAGLVWEVDSAERGGHVSASDGWHEGFRRWWRVLGIGLVLILPFMVLILLLLAFAGASLVAILGSASGAPAASSVWAALAGLAAVVVVAAPLIIVLAFALGTMYVLAVRHMVLENRRVMDAIGAGWHSFRHRFKDVLLMWLVMLGVAIGFGIALAIPAGIAGAIVGVTAYLGVWPVAAVLGFALFAVLVVIGAAWNTFISAAWTVFFRRLTGRDVSQMRPAASPYPVASVPTATGYDGYPPAGPPMAGNLAAPAPPPQPDATSGQDQG